MTHLDIKLIAKQGFDALDRRKPQLWKAVDAIHELTAIAKREPQEQVKQHALRLANVLEEKL